VVGPSESTILLLRGLLQVIRHFGLMDVLYFDHGPGFISRDTHAVCANLETFGIKIDPEKNAACRATEADISAKDSPAKIFVIPANEELVLAREVYRQISNQP
jgi:acetate kinase